MLTIGVILLLVGLDRLSKALVVKHLMGQPPLDVISSHVQFYYVENRGAAFGILQDARLFFLIITILVLGVLLYFLPRVPKWGLAYWSFLFIIGGAVGNFIDRVRLHYVVDFIKTEFFGYSFAVFNLADTFIVLGAIGLMVAIIMSSEGSLS